MRIREGFVLKNVADMIIVVPAGSTSLDFNGMITLNDTGAFLWNLLTSDTTEEELTAAMLKEYDVDEPTALAGVKKFISRLEAEGLLA